MESPKFTQPLLDTPQTVTVIRKEVIQQQGATSLTEALRNTPGITLQLGENGNTQSGDTIFMRGFDTQSSIFVDGIRDIGPAVRDVFNVEQVEIFKGPAGADNGRGATSGYVNRVLTNPTNLSTELNTGAIRHSLSTGFEFIYESQYTPTIGNLGTLAPTSLYNPDRNGVFTVQPAIAATGAYSDYLKHLGVRHFLVDVGGEIRAQGMSAEGAAWQVAIERPPVETNDHVSHAGTPSQLAAHVISLRDAGIATSGNYRYYFDYDGRRYSHRIDPRTGEPVAHSLVSVTVIAPECLHADALATALTVLGPDEGMLCATARGIAALFILRTADGLAERMTPRFAAYLN